MVAMILLGLTGGIGMGKSTAATLLAGMGVSVVDTDQLARTVVEPGQPALQQIREAFGSEVLSPDGSLRREVVAQLVFAEETKRKVLESILHPRIRDLWMRQVAEWRAEQKSVAAVVIPLLHETNAVAQFDRVICVACSAASQRHRLEARGWSLEQINQRISAQWPAQKKMDGSHHVIWTEPSREVHAAQLELVLRQLRG